MPDLRRSREWLRHSSIVVAVVLSLSLVTASIVEEGDHRIARFQSYLRINTAHPAPNYHPAVDFLRSQALALDLETRVLEFVPQKPLLLVTWRGSDPSLPSILLNSHMDTVPADSSRWRHPPFSAVRSPEGNIYGRGAQDDKCIGLQYMEAIRTLKSGGQFSPLRTVHLSYVPDEEIGGLDGAAEFANSDEFARLNVGFMLDEGQASTGDEFRVFYADRIPWKVKIQAYGAPGHGYRMYDNSAMENLVKSMEVISKYREIQYDIVKAGLAENSEVVSVNPVYIDAGVPSPTGFLMNLQPSEAEAGFDVRLPPTADHALLRRRISEEWAPAARNMTFQIIEHGPVRDAEGRPLMTAANCSNPWWAVFVRAVQEAGGRFSKPEILASTTDARFFRQVGVPVLGFSPVAHTPVLLHEHDEFMKDTVYLKGIEVYESVIRSLCSFRRDRRGVPEV